MGIDASRKALLAECRAHHPCVFGVFACVVTIRTRAVGAQARSDPATWGRAMKKLTLDLDSLGVETFTIEPELSRDAAFMLDLISRKSCIEQCTTSCVP